MLIDEDEYLSHYGIIRRSGRYPWGSGNNTASYSQFLEDVKDLQKQGLSEKQIAEGFGASIAELRNEKSIAKNAIKASNIAQAERLRNKGMSNVAIGQQMGLPESSVRSLLKADTKDKTNILDSTVDVLERQIADKNYIDVGKGTEYQMNISEGRLKQAIHKMKDLGYQLFYIKEKQLGTGKETSIKVLAHKDATYSEVSKNRADIAQIQDRSFDGGRTYLGIYDPLSISSRRVAINYAEDGGAEADGVIYVRPGKDDVSLGGSNYAQVRIAVDGTHYLKGMAFYKDDLPEGIDLVFNTNKSQIDAPRKLDALKPMNTLPDGSIDPDNPFGASISRQVTRTKRDGTVVAASAMNIVNEEGDWGKWSKNLSSQMLSKQSTTLARAQLKKAFDQQAREFDRINELTNPVIRKKLLDSFADGADASSVHLKAAALGARQATQVILPIPSLKDTEVYAPNFNDGERVVLIRYPHAGTFEIPELTVNNRQREARKVIGQARDAVGINSRVAEQLSGADFDGDTVLVIPNNQGRVKTSPAIKGLQDFDPRSEYKEYDGMKRMTAREKGRQMGDVSNLITDMTIKGAPVSEITRAVKHSMVVIDAEKHNLNWRLSEEQNGIKDLKRKYQGGAAAGAATLVSRATARADIPAQRPRRASEGGAIDPKTGKKVFVPTEETFVNKKGKTVVKKQRTTKLAVAEDASELLSAQGGTQMERIYADHSNRLKALANRARKESLTVPKVKESPSAKKVYASQVDSLNSQLAIAKRNAPFERQAQLLGNAVYKRKLGADPDMPEATKKKVRGQALQEARARVGAKKTPIQISDLEWEAIQAGAFSNSRTKDIIDNADLDRVKELATPKPRLALSSAKAQRAQAMLQRGATRSEVANALGVSLTTLDEHTDARGGEFLE